VENTYDRLAIDLTIILGQIFANRAPGRGVFHERKSRDTRTDHTLLSLLIDRKTLRLWSYDLTALYKSIIIIIIIIKRATVERERDRRQQSEQTAQDVVDDKRQASGECTSQWAAAARTPDTCHIVILYQLYFANMAAQYKYKKYEKYKLYTKSPNASHGNQ